VAAPLTLTAEAPDFPSEVALTFAVPAATALTRPVEDTVATAGFELDQVMERPLSTVPAASLSVTCNWTESPTASDGADGVVITVATAGAGTVTVAVPVLPSEVAAMVLEPAVTAVTSPVALTVATALFEVDQTRARPASGAPFASFGVAVS